VSAPEPARSERAAVFRPAVPPAREPAAERPAAEPKREGAPEKGQRPAAKPAPKPAAKPVVRNVGFDGGAWVMAISVTAAMVYGWNHLEDYDIRAKDGVGYWLGIVGGVMMLVLLLYPLRKKYRSWRILGKIPTWFRAHMVLGVLGPALIMYHCSFKLGSTNSNLALFSMLIVAGSGVVGRYLYRMIHVGLYGEKLKIREMMDDAGFVREEVGQFVADASGVFDEMKRYEQRVLNHPETLRGAFWGVMIVSLGSGGSRRRLNRAISKSIKVEAKAQRWSSDMRRKRLASARGQVNMYFDVLRKAANLAFFERLFALWHILHLPLFFVLILTTIVHIVAVHLY
jgi:hypothetical protein